MNYSQLKCLARSLSYMDHLVIEKRGQLNRIAVCSSTLECLIKLPKLAVCPVDPLLSSYSTSKILVGMLKSKMACLRTNYACMRASQEYDFAFGHSTSESLTFHYQFLLTAAFIESVKNQIQSQTLCKVFEAHEEGALVWPLSVSQIKMDATSIIPLSCRQA